MSNFYNPVQIEFGRGSIDFLARFIKGRKALLVTSQGFVKRGVVSRLTGEHTEITAVVDAIQPNPTIEQMLMVRESLDYSSFEVIIALGGGSVIDAAKAIAPYSGDTEFNFLTALTEGLPENVAVKPIIALPTTAGTGSEVTMWGTIWDDVNRKKYSIADCKLYCEAALLDVNLHVTIPRDLTIQTCLDALSHSLEALWNKNENAISDTYAISAIQIIVETLPLLVNDLDNIELREKMLLASYRAGLAFSNTQTALAHAMSYYMTLHKGIPHGIAASFTLPAIIAVAMSNDHLAQKLRKSLGENPQQVIEHILDQLGVSTKCEDYKLLKGDWTNILQSLKSTPRANNSLVNAEKVISLFTKEG